MAFFFGGNFVTDAFNLAFKVPNIFRQVFGESMYERAFMPPFNRLRKEGRYAEARALLVKTFVISQVLVILFMVVVYMLLPWILRMLGAGFKEDALGLPLELARVFLPYMLIISLATFAGSLLRYTQKREFLYGISPAVQNIVLMIFMLVFYKTLGIFSMVYGYLFGSMGFLIVQLPSVRAIWKDLKRPEPKKQVPELGSTRKAFGQGGHLFISSLLNKSIDLVDAAVASLTGIGAISALAYSRRVLDLPVTLFGMAFSTLPAAKAVSDLKGKKKVEDIPGAIALGLKVQFLLLVPVSIFCVCFSTELMTLFFKRGAFSETALNQTSLAFSFFCVGMFPMGMRRFFADIFPAIENARPLIFVSLAGAIVNISLDFLLYQTSLKHGGIALATSISYVTQCLLMFFFLARAGISLSGQGLTEFVTKSSISMVGYAAVMVAIKLWIPEFESFWSLAGFVLVAGGGGLILLLLITVPFLVKRKDDRLRLMLTGGGTGGHVYPSLAVHEILKSHFEIEEVCYLGLKNKPEASIVTKKGLPFKTIVSAPMAGLSPRKILKSLPLLAMGTIQSMAHILKFNPNTVVASGGYVSAPVIVAAAILRPFLKIKIILHEQNLVPGFMNKAASLLADLTFVNFKESAFLMWNTRCVHAGYPVRKEFLTDDENRNVIRQRLGIPEDKFLVVAYGGSIGARSMNQCLAEALPLFAEDGGFFLIHGIGLNQSKAYDAVDDTIVRLEKSLGEQFHREEMEAVDNNGEVFYRGYPYLHDMGDFQKAADLVVCRAGAGAIAEIMALGKPALVIPKRGLPGNHQELNAIELREKGACDLLFETHDPELETDTIAPDFLFKRICLLRSNPEQMKAFQEGARRHYFRNSELAVADAIRDFSDGLPVDYITTIEEPAVVKHQRLFDSLIAHLHELPEEHILRDYYRSKVDEYLKSSHFLVVNKGIKLMSVFRDPELYSYIYEHFSDFKGFLKRNSLSALKESPTFYPEFIPLIEKGIKDSYFETRREAIALYRSFYKELNQEKGLQDLIIKTLKRRFESFEVRSEAIRASVLFLQQSEFEKRNRKFLFSQNMRLRFGLLQAIEDGLKLNCFEDIPEIRKFVKQIMLTNADFVPSFKIREQFKAVAASLRATGEKDEGDTE